MKIFFLIIRVSFIMTWGVLARGGGGDDIIVWGGAQNSASVNNRLLEKSGVTLLNQRNDEIVQAALPLHATLVEVPRIIQNDDFDFNYSDETDSNNPDTSLSDDSDLSSEITPRPSTVVSPSPRVQFFLPIHTLPTGSSDAYRPPALRRGSPEEPLSAKKKVTWEPLEDDSDSSEEDSVEPFVNPVALGIATGGSSFVQSLTLKIKQLTGASFYPSSSFSRGHGTGAVSHLSKSSLLKLLMNDSDVSWKGALLDWVRTRQIFDNELGHLRGNIYLILHILVRNFDLEGLQFLVDAWSNKSLLKALHTRDENYNGDSVLHTLIRTWGKASRLKSGHQLLEAQQIVLQMLEFLQRRSALCKADRFLLFKKTNDLGETPMHLFAQYLWADGLDSVLSCMPSEIWQWCEGIPDGADVSHFKFIEFSYQNQGGFLSHQNTYTNIGHLSELFMLKTGKKEQTPLHLASIGKTSPQQVAFVQVVYRKLLDMDYPKRDLILSIADIDGATCDHYAQANGFQWRFW